MADSNSQIRVFVALGISDQARVMLTDVIARLRDVTGNGVRWVNPLGIHLTLKFLGDIPAVRAMEVLESVNSSSAGHVPFRLGLSGLGMFPNQRQPRVLWAGVTGDLDALSELQESVESGMAELGFSRERRPFRAHLTIGRVRDGTRPQQRQSIADAVLSMPALDVQSWEAESVHLIRSNLLPQGAVYTSLGSAQLG